MTFINRKLEKSIKYFGVVLQVFKNGDNCTNPNIFFDRVKFANHVKELTNCVKRVGVTFSYFSYLLVKFVAKTSPVSVGIAVLNKM